MARLILSMDGLVLNEYRLADGRITIGRKPTNTIVIDNQAVSGEHAAIVSVLDDCFLEDLDSTNGTQVNGATISKVHLQDNDAIEIGKYKLKYLAERDQARNRLRATEHAVSSGDEAAWRGAASDAIRTGDGRATLQIQSGPNAGREVPLTRNLTTLGKPGEEVVAITRRNQGYFISHVEGQVRSLVNGLPLGEEAVPLNNHDVLEVSGIKMEFFFK